MSGSSVWIFNSLQALMKLVPWSGLRTLEVSHMANNLLQAIMKFEADMDSITSMWTARVPRKVNSTAQCLFSAVPPLIRCETTLHGPQTSMLTLVNGGSMASLSTGKLAVFGSSGFPLSLQHVTH